MHVDSRPPFQSAPSRGSACLRALSGTVFAVLLCAPLASHAQSAIDSDREMTLEELESYIAEQKEALEIVQENRAITESKSEALEAELGQRQERLADVEAELAELCAEREAIEPGSLETCLTGS